MKGMVVQLKDFLYSLRRAIYDYGRLIFEFLGIWVDWTRRRDIYRNCHLAVFRNPTYLRISVFAIASLLKKNPDFTVTIHTDQFLSSRTRVLCLFFPRNRVKHIQDLPHEGFPYTIKGLFLLKLQGTPDFFLDADTRVNGVLPVPSSPLALVAEFSFESSQKWSRIFESLEIKEHLSKKMLNVSLVSWAGQDLGISDSDFLEWERRYMGADWNSFLDLNEVETYKRFVEQVFISIRFQEGNFQVLKPNDQVADRGLVESSYFGASGYRFGR